MSEVLNRKLSAIMKISIFIGVLFLVVFSNPLPAKASWHAHLNENGDVEIYTRDKKKTSAIYYQTIGVDITRCQYNPAAEAIHSSNDFFLWKLDNPIKDVGDIYVDNTYTIPINTIIALASSQDPAWGDEIRKAIEGTGPAVYIKLDCIMITHDTSAGIDVITGPYRNAPGLEGGGYLTSGICNGTLIENAYGWANKYGLHTHYNHYLIIGQGEEEPPKGYGDEKVCDDYTIDHYAGLDTNTPAYATGNKAAGDKYNLYEGIPSSEYIENSFLADAWYGNLSVWARVVAKQYKHNMNYFWWVDTSHYEQNVWVSSGYYESTNVDLPIGYATVAFQYLADVNMYDFTDAEIENGAFPGDYIHYSDGKMANNGEIPMKCISTNDYVNVAEGDSEKWEKEPNWKADTEKHVKFPAKPSYPSSREIGSESELAAAITEDTKAIRNAISGGTSSRNDYLEIDGKKYMENEYVKGCDFFTAKPSSYTACKKSSACVLSYVKDSLKKTDPVDRTAKATVQIPTSVDNGYYSTTIQVWYQRLITKSRGVSTFKEVLSSGYGKE